uniref:RGS domain-containing protein n=1 Tax=Strongyloides papillosus TaxID=174720 RepID=A0A0N5BGJ0_STREA
MNPSTSIDNFQDSNKEIKTEDIMEISPTTSSSLNNRTPMNVDKDILRSQGSTGNQISEGTLYQGIHLTDIQFSGYTVSKTNGNHLTITLLNITPDPRGYRMSVDEVQRDNRIIDPVEEPNTSSQRPPDMQMDDYVVTLLNFLPRETIEKVFSESRRSACIKLYKIYYFLRDMNNHIITARAFAETVSIFFNLSPPILRKDIPNYLRPHVVDSLKDVKELLFTSLETEPEKVRAAFTYFFP